MAYKTKEEQRAYYRRNKERMLSTNNKWKDCSMCGIRYNSKNHLTTTKHLIAEQSLLSISLKKSLAKI